MRKYELTCFSSNHVDYAKPIISMVVEPEALTERTGVILCTHGWGNNRLWDEATLAYVTQFDLVAVSVEYRNSGYDFDAVRGKGWIMPYDASFYQVIDVLNALRHVLAHRPGLNRRRLFHYGASQGAHLAMLSAIYAPSTFAAVLGTCCLTYIEPKNEEWAGRSFQPHELSARNLHEHAHRIQCPVAMNHGTADPVCEVDIHTRALEGKLRAAGKEVTADYYEGGNHRLEPTTTRLEALKRMGPPLLGHRENAATDDFSAGRVIDIPCAGRILRVDWSRPTEDAGILTWAP